LDTTNFVILFQVVGEFFEWWSSQGIVLPEFWSQEIVGTADSLESSFGEVTEGGGTTTSTSVNIFKTSHLHKLLWDWTADETSTTWGWDETDVDGTTFTVDLSWDSVWCTELVTPVTTSDWDNRELGKDDGTTDSGGDFLGALDTKTDVTIFITNSDDGLESGTLTGTGLFLDWLDLQDFVLQLWTNEMIDDFEFLDWESKGVDFFQRFDFTILDKSSQFSDWLPFFGFTFTATTTLATTSTTWTSTTASSAAKSSAKT